MTRGLEGPAGGLCPEKLFTMMCLIEFLEFAISSPCYFEKVTLGASFLSCVHLASDAIHGKEFLWTQFVLMLTA